MSCQLWRQSLAMRHYSVGHFHLSPTQVGLPNDRPRYYCIALQINTDAAAAEDSLEDSNEEEEEEDEFHEIVIREKIIQRTTTTKTTDASNMDNDIVMADDAPRIQTHIPMFISPPLPNSKNDPISLLQPLPPISKFLDESSYSHLDDNNNNQKVHEKHHHPLCIPESILHRNASWCFDIVTPFDYRSSCFTSSYGRFIRGTGSILCQVHTNTTTTVENKKVLLQNAKKQWFAFIEPKERIFDSNWWNGLNNDDNNDGIYYSLRYFSGTEIARLMGFPISNNNKMKNNNMMIDESKSNNNNNNNNGIDDEKKCCVNSGEEIIQERSTFEFPSNITTKQQWKLLGNSLNVRVAARLVEAALCLFNHPKYFIKKRL